MTTLAIFLALVFWFGCGVLAYGLSLAYFQRGWPTLAEKGWDKDQEHAIVAFFFGPCALVVALGNSKHGLMFRNPHKKKNV